MRGDKIPLELPEYVWDGLIPTRSITHIVGPSGVGKSTLAMFLAAAWTRGELTGKREKVVLAMTEDDEGMTTMPRFIAHGGIEKYVHIPEGAGDWEFPRDTNALRRAIGTTGSRIVIIDPLQGTVPGIVGQKGRRILGDLDKIAKELGVAIVFLHHFIKSAVNSKTVAQAIGGGYGVYGLPRSILLLGWEPPTLNDLLDRAILDNSDDDEEESEDEEEVEYDEDDEPEGERIVLAHEKHSLGPLHPSILFVRQSHPHPAAPDDPQQTISIFTQVKHVKHSALAVMHSVRNGSDIEDLGTPREQAKTLILALLAQTEEVGMRASELEGRVIGAGIAKVTVQRARTDLHKEHMIEPFQKKDKRGKTIGWRWRLIVPDTVEEIEE